MYYIQRYPISYNIAKIFKSFKVSNGSKTSKIVSKFLLDYTTFGLVAVVGLVVCGAFVAVLGVVLGAFY
jgi:hypothetical protein